MENVETLVKEQVYKINYSVPTELQETLDILIEQDLGHGDGLIVHDDCSEQVDGKIEGYVIVEFENEFNSNTLQSVSEQFSMLSNGEDLVI